MSDLAAPPRTALARPDWARLLPRIVAPLAALGLAASVAACGSSSTSSSSSASSANYNSMSAADLASAQQIG